MITVFEYRYNYSEYSWYNMDSWGNDVYGGGGNGVYWQSKYVFSKKYDTGNAYARMNCTSPIDTVRKNSHYNCRIRLTHIIMR